MKIERVRNYAMITYHSEEVIKATLDCLLKMGRVRHYAYIPHDKDMDSEGNFKEKHIHMLLQLNNAMTLTAVRALFPLGANTLAQPIYDKADCFNYLTHKDKPNKYQYEDTDIVADNMEYWKGLQKGQEDDKTMCILDDIISNVPYRLMVSRYGRDFVINYGKYACMAQMIESEESRHLRSPAKERAYLIEEETGEIFHRREQLKINP